MTSPDAASGGRAKQAGYGCLLLVIVSVAVGFLMTSCGSGNEATERDWERLAVQACHDSVKQQLKNPGAAEFTDETVTKTSTGWDIAGTVHSTNSFGGTVPEAYQCVTTREADRVTATSRLG